MSWLGDDDGGRICDAYPVAATSVDGQDWDATLAELWKVIPNDPDLTGWIRVEPGARMGFNKREYRVQYDEGLREPASPQRPWTLTLNVYGIVDDLNLSKTGNWEGTEASAARAVQFVKLVGGALPAPFRTQADVLHNIEQWVIGTIRGGGLSVRERDKAKRRLRKGLYLSRRTFTKVSSNTPPAIVNTGPAARIMKKWRVIDTARLGQRQMDDSVRSTSAATFAPGDFVQAVIKLDVVAETSRRGPVVKGGSTTAAPDVQVRFSLVSLFQLVAARNVAKVLQIPNAPTVQAPDDEGAPEEAIDGGVEFTA